MLPAGPPPGGFAEQRRPPLPFGSGARALLLRIQEPKLRLAVSGEAELHTLANFVLSHIEILAHGPPPCNHRRADRTCPTTRGSFAPMGRNHGGSAAEGLV